MLNAGLARDPSADSDHRCPGGLIRTSRRTALLANMQPQPRPLVGRNSRPSRGLNVVAAAGKDGAGTDALDLRESNATNQFHNGELVIPTEVPRRDPPPAPCRYPSCTARANQAGERERNQFGRHVVRTAPDEELAVATQKNNGRDRFADRAR